MQPSELTEQVFVFLQCLVVILDWGQRWNQHFLCSPLSGCQASCSAAHFPRCRVEAKRGNSTSGKWSSATCRQSFPYSSSCCCWTFSNLNISNIVSSDRLDLESRFLMQTKLLQPVLNIFLENHLSMFSLMLSVSSFLRSSTLLSSLKMGIDQCQYLSSQALC